MKRGLSRREGYIQNMTGNGSPAKKLSTSMHTLTLASKNINKNSDTFFPVQWENGNRKGRTSKIVQESH